MIRHTPGDAVVAVIELVTPENKRRREAVGAFAGRVVDCLNGGVHVLVIDILAPTRSTPCGMHGPIWSLVEHHWATTSWPADRPLLVASYRAERQPIAYLSFTAIGRPLPAGPLYLDETKFIDVPLDATYRRTFDNEPKPVTEPLRGAAAQ